MAKTMKGYCHLLSKYFFHVFSKQKKNCFGVPKIFLSLKILQIFFFFKPFRVKRAQFAVFFMHALLQAIPKKRSCI